MGRLNRYNHALLMVQAAVEDCLCQRRETIWTCGRFGPSALISAMKSRPSVSLVCTASLIRLRALFWPDAVHGLPADVCSDRATGAGRAARVSGGKRMAVPAGADAAAAAFKLAMSAAAGPRSPRTRFQA